MYSLSKDDFGCRNKKMWDQVLEKEVYSRTELLDQVGVVVDIVYVVGSVVDPDPAGSSSFGRIRIHFIWEDTDLLH